MSKATKAQAERAMKKARKEAQQHRAQAKASLKRAKTIKAENSRALYPDHAATRALDRKYRNAAKDAMANARIADQRAKVYEKRSKSLIARILGGK